MIFLEVQINLECKSDRYWISPAAVLSLLRIEELHRRPYGQVISHQLVSRLESDLFHEFCRPVVIDGNFLKSQVPSISFPERGSLGVVRTASIGQAWINRVGILSLLERNPMLFGIIFRNPSVLVFHGLRKHVSEPSGSKRNVARSAIEEI